MLMRQTLYQVNHFPGPMFVVSFIALRSSWNIRAVRAIEMTMNSQILQNISKDIAKHPGSFLTAWMGSPWKVTGR